MILILLLHITLMKYCNIFVSVKFFCVVLEYKNLTFSYSHWYSSIFREEDWNLQVSWEEWKVLSRVRTLVKFYMLSPVANRNFFQQFDVCLFHSRAAKSQDCGTPLSDACLQKEIKKLKEVDKDTQTIIVSWVPSYCATKPFQIRIDIWDRLLIENSLLVTHYQHLWGLLKITLFHFVS